MGEDDEPAGGSQSRRSGAAADGGVHYLAKCVLRGSAVLHAVQGHLRSPTSDDIVFGKETSLEMVVLGEDGIVQSICEQTVFGTIKDLAVLRLNETCRKSQPRGKDLLVVLSDSGKLSFLSFCSEMHRFYATMYIELSTPGNSRHQLGRMLAVDSDGSFIAVSAYEDRFAIFSVSTPAGNNIIDEKYFYPPENVDPSIAGNLARLKLRGTIWSMCFISKGTHQLTKEGYNPVLAVVMHRIEAASNGLYLFGCDRRKNIIHVLSRHRPSGPLALSISGIPHIPGFALLFRKGDVLLMDLRDPMNITCMHRINFNFSNVIIDRNFTEECQMVMDVDDICNAAAYALLGIANAVRDDDPMNIDSESRTVDPSSKHVCSWSWESGDPSNPKLIFCLDTGEVYVIELQSDAVGISLKSSECLYRGSPYGVLLWAKGGLIIGLVEMGDGLVLKLEHEKLVYKSAIQNIAPILDLSVVDDDGDKHDHMFACCGANPNGSLRIIRNGISVDKLLRTNSIYQGVTGTWTVRMKESDSYHSFLVLSFVEETRILSVGLSFIDVSDAVGFLPNASTLACGLVVDGLLVQIHKGGVRLCLPTTFAHIEGVPLSTPICSSWCPDNLSISLGAVGRNLIIVATSNPCFIFVLGIRSLSAYHYEIYEIQHFRLQHEVSCISIPRGEISCEKSESGIGLPDEVQNAKIDFGKCFVIGTHRPSVEIISFLPEGLKVLATGIILVHNAHGSPIGGCIPQDVKFVSSDRPYILSGLRNGMLLRYEWPASSVVMQPEKMDYSSSSITCPHSSGTMMENTHNDIPAILQLVAVRRIGVTPVFLVPLDDSVDSDIIILSDRPWLLQTARQSLAYTSISFQSATHVTPVCSVDCFKGILFVAENSLHLVEMVHSKRLNVQKFPIRGTPRKLLYHNESKTLLVLRTGLNDTLFSSDICRIDAFSGKVLSYFPCDPGETAKCMQMIKVGNEQVLVVGTSQSAGHMIMPSGEPESARGRLIVLSLDNLQSSSDSSRLVFCSNASQSSRITSPLREIVGYATEQLSNSSLCSSPDDNSCDGIKLEEVEAGHLHLVFDVSLQGSVLSICPYLDRYVLASAGNTLNVFGFLNENPRRLRKFAMAKTRFAITCLTTQFTRIMVGDCRDGVLFFSYQEDLRKLEHLYSDPVQRLVADCALVDLDTAVVSDRKGNISILSARNHLEGTESPERNLMLSSSYYLGETVMSIRKGSFTCKLPADDVLNSCDGVGTVFESTYNSIVASTLLGSVLILIPITSEEHQLLESVQDKLSVHPLTSPILGNNHKEFRRRGSPAGVCTILDGDMLAQFLELTSMQQEAVLASPGMLSSRASDSGSQCYPISVNQVVRLLERVHYALN